MRRVLHGCQTACYNCNDSEANTEEPLKLKVCSWAEEEVGGMHEGPKVGLDYGFLGRPANSTASPRTAASSVASSPAASRTSSPALSPRRTSPESEQQLRVVTKTVSKLALASRPRLYEPGALTPIYTASATGSSNGAQPKKLHIHDLYEFDPEPLGRGSYGEVVGATHRRTKARRAIKVVTKAGLRHYVRDVDVFVRREVDILRRLDHPNVVRLYEAYEDAETIYIVLEVCDGGDLLERVTVACERMPEHVAARLMVQMLCAVQHLGLRGIVHRDLKPENFLFSRREPEGEPLPPSAAPLKLIDFGLSRRMAAEGAKSMTPKIGTTEYMAPEAFLGRIDPGLADRTDVWSLGVVLHVIFIGHFPSPMISEVAMDEYLALPCWSHISRDGRALMGQLLQKDPRKRPTVTMVLRHRWLANCAGISPQSAEVSRCLHNVIRLHDKGMDLRRIALAYAAREVEDGSCHRLRETFQALTIVCEGALTKVALERVSLYLQTDLRCVAEELVRNFVVVDMDGSGSIDWTEFVAIALGGSLLVGENLHVGALPPLQQDTCWRSFDILSQGSGCISQKSLEDIFQPQDACGMNALASRSESPALKSSACRTGSVADLTQLVREVDIRGVGRSSFLSLLQGR